MYKVSDANYCDDDEVLSCDCKCITRTLKAESCCGCCSRQEQNSFNINSPQISSRDVEAAAARQHATARPPLHWAQLWCLIFSTSAALIVGALQQCRREDNTIDYILHCHLELDSAPHITQIVCVGWRRCFVMIHKISRHYLQAWRFVDICKKWFQLFNLQFL